MNVEIVSVDLCFFLKGHYLEKLVFIRNFINKTLYCSKASLFFDTMLNGLAREKKTKLTDKKGND